MKRLFSHQYRGNWAVDNIEFAPSFIPRGCDVIALDVLCPRRWDGLNQPVLVLALAVPPQKQLDREDKTYMTPGQIPVSYQSRGLSHLKEITEEIHDAAEDEDIQFFLHVFGGKAADADGGDVIPIEFVAKDYMTHAQVTHLNYSPFMLTHTSLGARTDHTDLSDLALVLLGNDGAIHVHRREWGDFIPCKDWEAGGPQPAEGSDLDVLCDLLTAGMASLPSAPIVIDIKRYGSDRIVAVACKCGHVRVVQCRLPLPYTATPSVFSCHVDGPISSVKLFSRHGRSMLKSLRVDETNVYGEKSDDAECEVNLLVCSAIGPAIVLSDVLHGGLGEPQVLEGSKEHDALLCSCVGDLDFDGLTELLIGTYGQQLLVYKWNGSVYTPYWTREFSHPIMGLELFDAMRDGVRHIVVTSQRSVHFLQPDMQAISSKI